MTKDYLSVTNLGLFLVAVQLPLKLYAEPQPVPKVEFEQRSRVLVWDIGPERGIVDRADNLTDLEQECSIGDSSIIPNPVQIMRAKKAVSKEVLKQTVARILAQFNISDESFKMTAVDAFSGNVKEPVFLLFPEQHLINPVKKELGELHEVFAQDILKITALLDGQNIKIINTSEGPQGSWKAEFKLAPKTLKERFTAAYELMAAKWIGANQLVGEIYGDRVLTQYHDNNALTVQYVLSLQAYVASFGSRSDLNSLWTRARARLISQMPVRSSMVDVDSFRNFFEQTVLRSSEDIKSISARICEERSREMARYSYLLAKQQDARVVYMGFGALHAHGVIEQLRLQSASYVVFSPNF